MFKLNNDDENEDIAENLKTASGFQKSEFLIYNNPFQKLKTNADKISNIGNTIQTGSPNYLFDEKGIFASMTSRWYRFLPTYSKLGYGHLIRDKRPSNANVETWHDYVKKFIVKRNSRRVGPKACH